jgi:hypothetical protein
MGFVNNLLESKRFSLDEIDKHKLDPKTSLIIDRIGCKKKRRIYNRLV